MNRKERRASVAKRRGKKNIGYSRQQMKVAVQLFPLGEESLRRKLCGLGFYERVQLCGLYASTMMRGPLEGAERELGISLLNAVSPCEWFHGGPLGFRHGDKLLPPTRTGRHPIAGDQVNCLHRMSVVFFSHTLVFAKSYADRRKRGAVYRVEPIGEVQADPENVRTILLLQRYSNSDVPEIELIKGFCAPSARILEVLT